MHQVATAPNIPRQPRGSPTRPEQSDLNDTITGLEATSKRVDAERRIDADPSHRIGDPSKAQKVRHHPAQPYGFGQSDPLHTTRGFLC